MKNVSKFVHPKEEHQMLKKEFQYYLDNQTEFLKKHLGKFLVIKNQGIIGVYDSHAEAFDSTILKEELGTFLIQHCLPGDEAIRQTFHSRVIVHA